VGLAASSVAQAARVVVIGDSLSAEYDAILDYPGTENPTRYAAVTVPGWESLCWVEVLARLRPTEFDFGANRPSLPGWLDLRFSGYEYNFAIPGFQAAHFEDIVNSSFFSNPQYLTYRATLADTLKRVAERVVVWLGANEFRANYGHLYEGLDPGPLVAQVRHDVEEVLAFVQRQNAQARVVLVNLPDLGASPDKQAAHPDPAKRVRVTEATRLANRELAALAAARGVRLADVFAQTERLLAGEPTWLGPILIRPGADPDNDPRYHFTRDGLHPNTPLQILIGRTILEAFDEPGVSLSPITNAEALALLGLDPLEPWGAWIATYPLVDTRLEGDPDQDRWVNLVEYVFGLDPSRPDPSPVGLTRGNGRIEVGLRPDPARLRLVTVAAEHSADLVLWQDLPPGQVSVGQGGAHTAWVPLEGAQGYMRLLLQLAPLDRPVGASAAPHGGW